MDPEDNIFISGMSFNSSGSHIDLFVVKYNNLGMKIWENVHESNWLYDMTIDSEGVLFAVGGVIVNNSEQFDNYLFQLNDAGEMLSNHTWGDSILSERSYGIAIDEFDRLFVMGYVEDLVEENSDVFLTKLHLDPILEIVIDYPNHDGLYGNNAPDFSITTLSEPDIETWYTLDGGIVNISFIGNSGIINQLEWGKQEDGIVNLQFYINDSTGRIKSDEVIIIKDTKKPLIEINYPVQSRFYGNSAPDFNISIIETHLDSTWYSLNGGIGNIRLNDLTGTIDQLEWDKSDDGVVEIKFYGNDSLGLVGSTEVLVFKDTVDPHILFIGLFPLDDEDYPPNFTIAVIEPNLESIGYSIDEGMTYYNSSQFSKDLYWTKNESYRLTGTINKEAWEKTTFINVTFRFYARDLSGNIAYRDIVFDKKRFDSEESDLENEEQILPGYQLLIIIGIIGIASIIAFKKYYKL